MKNVYQLLSILLSYPKSDWLDYLDELEQEFKKTPLMFQRLEPLIFHLKSKELIELQEGYVQTFDRNPAHSLHLFEHIHGEDRARGQALINLSEEYQKEGVEHAVTELPDYLPLFLEFLGLATDEKQETLLGEAVHIIAHIGKKLKKNESPYSVVFTLLEEMSPVQANNLTDAPIRDMDDALALYGVDDMGMEPLIDARGCPYQSRQEVQPIHFKSHECQTLKRVQL